MNALVSLIARIASGERLEPSTRQNTAWWLSGLAVVPVAIVGFALLAGFIESSTAIQLDSIPSLVGFGVLAGLVVLFVVLVLAKFLVGRPGILLLLAVLTWVGSAWLAFRNLPQ